MRGPFRVRPKPAWFCNHKTIHRLGLKQVAFTRGPSLGRLASLLADAVRG